MDFALTPEQEALREQARRFCEREHGFADRRARLPNLRQTWTRYAELGWLGAPLTEAEGGYGGPVEAMLLLEQLGGALSLEPYLASAVLASRAAAELGAGELVEALVEGRTIAALAHSEREVHCEARRTDDGWRLDGAKSFVLGAPAADLLLVSATGERDGLSLFAVPASAPGLTVRAYRAVDGRDVADLALSAVSLGPDALIGAEGGAAAALACALDHGVVGLCAEAVGAMDAALRMTRDYLRERRQFGTAIGAFQALQHRMADMHVECVLARSMLLRAVAALDDPAVRAREVSAAKVQIAESGLFVCGQAIQLHGGMGVTEEYAVGHYFKRLTLVRGLFGDTAAHLRRFIGA